MNDHRDARPHHPWWRFSLREVALLVFGVSACLALIVQSLLGRTTDTIPSLRLEQLIKEVSREQGFQVRMDSMGGGAMYSVRRIQEEQIIEVELTAADKVRLLQGLEEEIYAGLDGMQITGDSSSYTGGGGLRELSLWYDGWRVTGYIELYAVPLADSPTEGDQQRCEITLRGFEVAR